MELYDEHKYSGLKTPPRLRKSNLILLNCFSILHMHLGDCHFPQNQVKYPDQDLISKFPRVDMCCWCPMYRWPPSSKYWNTDWHQQLIKCKLLLSLYSQLYVVQYGEFGRWSLVGIKGNLLLSIYSQLCVVRYGEFDRWFLVGLKVCLTTNSSNTVHTFCSGQVERIRVRILRNVIKVKKDIICPTL